MSAVKGRASGPSLPPEKIGRMIRCLELDRRWRALEHRPWWERTPRHTKKDICALLGITERQYDGYIEAYKVAHIGRRWSYGTARDAFFKFVDENKRWPTRKDYRNWRVTGLPYPESIGWAVGGGSWYAREGVSELMSQYVQRHPRKVTPRMVLAIPNLTHRREAINSYGIMKLVSAGEKVQEDTFGVLWKLPVQEGADPFMMFVEVVNKTPRMGKDGAYVKDKKGEFVYDHYFLRVPPTCRTAREAVAWTFSRPTLDSESAFAFSAES